MKHRNSYPSFRGSPSFRRSAPTGSAVKLPVRRRTFNNRVASALKNDLFAQAVFYAVRRPSQYFCGPQSWPNGLFQNTVSNSVSLYDFWHGTCCMEEYPSEPFETPEPALNEEIICHCG